MKASHDEFGIGERLLFGALITTANAFIALCERRAIGAPGCRRETGAVGYRCENVALAARRVTTPTRR
jgi:hypothetical protein